MMQTTAASAERVFEFLEEEEEIEVEVGTPEAVPPEEPQIEGVEPGNEGPA